MRNGWFRITKRDGSHFIDHVYQNRLMKEDRSVGWYLDDDALFEEVHIFTDRELKMFLETEIGRITN